MPFCIIHWVSFLNADNMINYVEQTIDTLYNLDYIYMLMYNIIWFVNRTFVYGQKLKQARDFFEIIAFILKLSI